jgi:molecular chaperone Hsp33
VNGFISSQENRGNKKKEEEKMSDYMVRATAADGQIRAFAITSKEMTEEARVRHNSSPIVTAALGRAMSAAAMMGSMMKGEKDLLTLQIQGDGP